MGFGTIVAPSGAFWHGLTGCSVCVEVSKDVKHCFAVVDVDYAFFPSFVDVVVVVTCLVLKKTKSCLVCCAIFLWSEWRKRRRRRRKRVNLLFVLSSHAAEGKE